MRNVCFFWGGGRLQGLTDKMFKKLIIEILCGGLQIGQSPSVEQKTFELTLFFCPTCRYMALTQPDDKVTEL
jgi:hypothetical protein